jgi:hypothetical protein
MSSRHGSYRQSRDANVTTVSFNAIAETSTPFYATAAKREDVDGAIRYHSHATPVAMLSFTFDGSTRWRHMATRHEYLLSAHEHAMLKSSMLKFMLALPGALVWCSLIIHACDSSLGKPNIMTGRIYAHLLPSDDAPSRTSLTLTLTLQQTPHPAMFIF